jgi:hypothetical protein
MAVKPILSKPEREGAIWQKVQARINERLEHHRRKLESPATTPAEREGLVYRIDEIKEFLRLGAPAEEQETAAR